MVVGVVAAAAAVAVVVVVVVVVVAGGGCSSPAGHGRMRLGSWPGGYASAQVRSTETVS